MTQPLTRPIVFLDIDGVLNGDDYIDQFDHIDITIMMSEPHSNWFDPDCVARLNRITDAANAVIVVSSSWVNLYDKETLTETFARVGITAPVFDITDKHAPGRLARIDWWLGEWAPQVPWIVIDDDHICRKYKPRAVLTCEKYGLQDDEVERALRKFRKQIEG